MGSLYWGSILILWVHIRLLDFWKRSKRLRGSRRRDSCCRHFPSPCPERLCILMFLLGMSCFLLITVYYSPTGTMGTHILLALPLWGRWAHARAFEFLYLGSLEGFDRSQTPNLRASVLHHDMVLEESSSQLACGHCIHMATIISPRPS